MYGIPWPECPSAYMGQTGRHKVKFDLHCTDEAQNKAETRVCSYLAPYKTTLLIAQLAADCAAKGLLNLMTSSPVATGLAYYTHHLILSNFHSESNVQSYIIIYPGGEFYMS